MTIEFSTIDDGLDFPSAWFIEWGDGSRSAPGSGAVEASHTYSKPDDYEITVSVLDDDSEPFITAEYVHPIQVSVGPGNVVFPNFEIKEGEDLQLSGSIIGDYESISWDINGDGVFGDATELNALLDWDVDLLNLGIDGSSHDSIAVSLRATFENGDTATATRSLDVINVAPTGLPSTDAPALGIPEGNPSGGVYRVFFESVDEPASGDTLSYSFDFGNDGVFEVVDSDDPSAPIPADFSNGTLRVDGTYDVLAQVSDQDGGSSSYLTQFVVADVAPTIDLDGADVSTEGSPYELTIHFEDNGEQDGDIKFFINWDDGTGVHEFIPDSQTSPAIARRVLADDQDGPNIISVVAEDGKGTYPAVTKVINVANVDPEVSNIAVTQANGAPVITEGDPVRFTGDISDEGFLDSFTLQIDWGDGTEVQEVPIDALTTAFDEVHTYKNDGLFEIVAVLTDDDGGTATVTTSVNVINDAPTVIFTVSPSEPREGEVVTVSGRIEDAGVDDDHNVTVHWEVGQSTTLSDVGGSFSTTYVYRDDAPQGTSADDYSIIVTAVDVADISSSGSETILTTVSNVAPVLLSLSTDANDIPSAKSVGDTVTLTATFEDPGEISEDYSVEINWGDGNTGTGTVTYDVDEGFATVIAAHNYAVQGIFDVTAVVSDDDLGSSIETFSDRAVIGTYSNTAPIVEDQTFNVAENSATGTVVGTVAVTDDPNDTLTYQLTNLQQQLSMLAAEFGPTDGQLSSDLSLTIDINSTFTSPGTIVQIDIPASDADIVNNTSLADLVDDLNARFVTAGIDGLLTVMTGLDVNGNAIGERLSIGALDDSVLRLKVTGGEPLGFADEQSAFLPSLVSPAEFSIDSATGEITVADDVLDAETTTSYTLLATVTDFWGESDTAIVTIEIGDVNEFAPTLSLTSLVYQLDEFSPNGTVLDTAAASDDDATGSITFSLEGADLPFVIDPDTGVLAVSDSTALNFDITPQFAFDVVATDQGGLTERRSVVVNLNDVNPVTLPVNAVKIASSTWMSAEFLATIDPGASEGYVLTGATSPTETISWSNLDQLLIKFSEDVADRVDRFAFTLNGINVPTYQAKSVIYDPSIQTVTLQFDEAIDTDRLLLTVTDNANSLSHSVRFDVLPGDLTNNGIGSVADIGPLRAAMGSFVGDAEYDPYADINGSGAVAVDDIGPLRDHIGIFLPDGQPSSQSNSNKWDTNLDGFVSPIDALLVINMLATGQGEGAQEVQTIPQFFADVNEDGLVSAGDALRVINFLSTQSNSDIVEAEQIEKTRSVRTDTNAMESNMRPIETDPLADEDEDDWLQLVADDVSRQW
ncbi:MAG: dockerin type I domain-containing protein [Planctomycetota bacterium]